MTLTKIKKPVCELPVMVKHCKTCPFKPDEKGIWRDVDQANKVIERTLFKAQQICHHSESNNRCKGAFDFNFEIYKRLGLEHLLK